jgi:hypothetical protein
MKDNTYRAGVCERCHLQLGNVGSKSSSLIFKESFGIAPPEGEPTITEGTVS